MHEDWRCTSHPELSAYPKDYQKLVIWKALRLQLQEGVFLSILLILCVIKLQCRARVLSDCLLFLMRVSGASLIFGSVFILSGTFGMLKRVYCPFLIVLPLWFIHFYANQHQLNVTANTLSHETAWTINIHVTGHSCLKCWNYLSQAKQLGWPLIAHLGNGKSYCYRSWRWSRHQCW